MGRKMKLFDNLMRKFNPVSARRASEKVPDFYGYQDAKKQEIITCTVHGKKLLIRTDSPDLLVAEETLGSEFNILRQAFPRSSRGLIIDAGGYIGTAALALSELYPDATIVTMEPSSANYSVLERNVEGYSNIIPIKAALVSKRSGEGVSLCDRGTGNWGFTVIDAPCDRDAKYMETVATLTVDAVLERFGFDEIMIFKMDIEGAERDLFIEPSWLNKVQVLIVELHERIVSGCEDAFRNANKNRFVCSAGGEKMLSVGKLFFDTQSL